MGFLNATCSLTRFHIQDTIPQEFFPTIPTLLKKYAFQDIDEIPEERSFGWVCFDDMLDAEWQTAQPYKGKYIVFSLRLDTRRIPAGVIKKHLTIAIKEEKQRISEQNTNFISRERKKELKEQVLLQLRQRFLPVPSETNVLWSLENNEIWLASTQGSMIDLFMDYFKRTFALTLEQVTPYTLAAHFLDENAMIFIDRMEPTQFVAQTE